MNFLGILMFTAHASFDQAESRSGIVLPSGVRYLKLPVRPPTISVKVLLEFAEKLFPPSHFWQLRSKMPFTDSPEYVNNFRKRTY